MRTSPATPPSPTEVRGFSLRPPRLLTAVVLTALVAFGCSPAARTSIPPDATGTTLPVPTGPPAPSFPATLTDDEGTSVTIPPQPERIVSLTPATTEILFKLGVG